MSLVLLAICHISRQINNIIFLVILKNACPLQIGHPKWCKHPHVIRLTTRASPQSSSHVQLKHTFLLLLCLRYLGISSYPSNPQSYLLPFAVKNAATISPLPLLARSLLSAIARILVQRDTTCYNSESIARWLHSTSLKIATPLPKTLLYNLCTPVYRFPASGPR